MRKKIKIKIVDLQKLNNFVVDFFKFEIILSTKSTFELLKFEIQISQTTLDGESTKTKVVDLEKV